MSDTKIVTWWEPTGFSQKACPEAWAKFCSLADGENFDWFKSLEACGYDFIDREADYQDYNLQLNVARHSDGHIVVDLWDVNGRLALFFVEFGNADWFFITKYLEIRKDIVAIQSGEIERDMRRYQLAFIRHGHGENTVSPDGWKTLDERREDQRQAEERRKAREQSSAPSAS